MSIRPKSLTLGALAYSVIAVAVMALALAKPSLGLVVAALGLVAGPFVVWITLRAPAVTGVLLGAVAGAAPFATLPGTGTYLVIFLQLWFTVAVIVSGRRAAVSARVVFWSIVVLLAVSALSLIMTFTGIGDVLAFIRWGLAVSITLVVLAANDLLRRAVLQAFVYGVTFGAALALGMLVFDPAGQLLNSLQIIGYGDSSRVGNLRTVDIDGQSLTRISGLYVDPNVAALFILFALGIAGAQLRGWVRLTVVLVLGVATVATLSRGAIGALLIGVVFVLVISRRSAGAKLAAVAAGALAVSALYWVPFIRDRLFDSFDTRTVGVSDRVSALENYPTQMADTWGFGRGWNLREFSDAAYGYTLNHVANTPLLIVWRAGILPGLVFVFLLLLVLVQAVRATRAAPGGADIAVAAYAGTIFFAFQVDFPVVTMAPLTLAFGLLVAQVCTLTESAPPSDVAPAHGIRLRPDAFAPAHP